MTMKVWVDRIKLVRHEAGLIVKFNRLGCKSDEWLPIVNYLRHLLYALNEVRRSWRVCVICFVSSMGWKAVPFLSLLWRQIGSFLHGWVQYLRLVCIYFSCQALFDCFVVFMWIIFCTVLLFDVIKN